MNFDDGDWSPDGTLIVLQSPPDPTPGVAQAIYTIHPDGTGLTRLGPDLGATGGGFQGSNHPSWSPDGTQIVFSHVPGMNGVADLFVMNRDGTDPRPLGVTPLNENGPDWGPAPTP